MINRKILSITVIQLLSIAVFGFKVEAFEITSSARYCLTTPLIQKNQGNIEHDMTLLLTDYARVFVSNRETFNPYSTTNLTTIKDQGVFLYRHLCQKADFKPKCKAHKEKLTKFFEQVLSNPSLITPAGPHLAQNSLEFLSRAKNITDRLRAEFHEAKQLIVQKGSSVLFESGTLSSRLTNPAQFNQAIQELYSTPQIAKSIEIYEKSYLDSARIFPGDSLLSPTLRAKIEGGHYELLFSDWILAVAETTKGLRKEFQELVNSNSNQLNSWYPHNLDQTLSNLNCAPAVSSFFSESDLYVGPASNLTFEAIQKFSAGDFEVLRLISKNQFQKAIWRLRNQGRTHEAQGLEDWLKDKIMNPNEVQKITPLGGGVTTSKVAHFISSVRGVYKPKPWATPHSKASLKQNLMDSIIGSYKNEIAVYRMDRLLGLNYVPITRVITLADGKGSLQYFIEGASTARELQEVDTKKPVESTFKWTVPKGRVAPPREVKFFDWLVDNIDRYVDNLMYLHNGQPVLVDHGLAFFSPIFIPPTKNQIREMIPNATIYSNLKRLYDNPAILDGELYGLVSPYRISLLKKRIRYFVDSVEEIIKQEESRAH